MLNRKSIIIFVGILLAAYLGVYFYTANMLHSAIAKKLEINEERIERSGFPFDITFKVKDNDKFKKLSYNILSKKIQLDLNFIPQDIENFKYKKYNVKALDYLVLSAKLESYFELMGALKGGISEIEAFNLTNNFQADVKGTTEESDLIVGAAIKLSFPGKRNFENFEDIISDFPRHFTGLVKYNIDGASNDDMPSFIKKIFELTYPESTEIYFEGSASNNLNFSSTSKADLINTLLNLDLNFTSNTDTKMIKSKSKLELKSKDSVYYADFNASETYKNDSVKNLYNSLSKEDISEFIQFLLHSMDMQLSDNTKSKITMLTDLAYGQIDKQLKANPKYWDKFYNLKTQYKGSLVVPTNQGEKDAKLFIHIPNDTEEFEFKIDGTMKGGISADAAKGTIFMFAKDNNIAEAIGYIRLVMFATDKSIKAEHFNSIVSAFEEDTKLIASELKNFSDDKEAPNYSYSYNIDMKNPLNSTISKNGNKIMELILFFSNLFTAPPIEPALIPMIDQAIPPVIEGALEGENVLISPADSPEEESL